MFEKGAKIDVILMEAIGVPLGEVGGNGTFRMVARARIIQVWASVGDDGMEGLSIIQ